MIPVIAVQLGRIGDILNILPPCKALGIKHMLIHPDFSCAIGGQSYVEPVYWNGDIEDLRAAVEYAKTIASDVRVAQLFGRVQPPVMPPRTRPSFVMDQWDRLQPKWGAKWGTLPLEFNKRDDEGENALIQNALRGNREAKPVLLVNLESTSSPFAPGMAGMIMAHLLQEWSDRFYIFGMAGLREDPFCNLLALYENAVGLITADTATLHLARAARNLRVFQFVRPDHDASPVIDRSQPYSYTAFDRIDGFLGELL